MIQACQCIFWVKSILIIKYVPVSMAYPQSHFNIIQWLTQTHRGNISGNELGDEFDHLRS